MKRALFISSRELWPVSDGSKIRTVQQLEFLAQTYQVDLLVESACPKRDVGRLSSYVREYHHIQRSKLSSILGTLRFLFNNRPLQVNYYYDSDMQSYVSRYAADYDLIFCNNIRTAEYVLRLDPAKRPVCVLDYVDAISMNYAGAVDHASGLFKWIYRIDSKRCAAYEKEMLHYFDHVMAISQKDAVWMGGEGKDNPIQVVSNGVEKCTSTFPQVEDPIVTFVGKMNYEPNEVAVTWFANQVLPVIKQVIPEVQFRIVGVSPSDKVLRLQDDPHVLVTGFVKDVTEEMGHAAVIVAPMLTGAGVQNKILMAMAAGCCVVTTPLGEEGIEGHDGALTVVEGAELFAATVIKLLCCPAQRKALGAKAQTFVNLHLTKEHVYADFQKALQHKNTQCIRKEDGYGTNEGR